MVTGQLYSDKTGLSFPPCPTPFSKLIQRALINCHHICVIEVAPVFTRASAQSSVLQLHAAWDYEHSKFACNFVHTLAPGISGSRSHICYHALPTDRTSSFSTFDSIELGRYSDDSNRDNEDRVAGECRHII